jgi:signal transduction histidine kinase
VEFLVLEMEGTAIGHRAMMSCFVLFKLVEIPCLIHLLLQMNRIREGGRRVAEGDYSHPINTGHMIPELRKHAENINNVGDGIAIAVEERMKSERFKTELITNVSHDIKTPLTSIINYVDLLKKEPIDNPTAQEYLTVLDRQSARLKKLIEDLIEASKASTGNLPVQLELCDATVMLTQVVGEFRERAEANNLDIVVESPEPPVNILADGRHLWRIIDNLVSNICKYALPGTRVYIDLERHPAPDQQGSGQVLMTFRNISRDRLNISSDELMARFVRGDSSRNTEGNGLGLSIAKSLADLMDAGLAIEIDGDLFKVILRFEEQ